MPAQLAVSSLALSDFCRAHAVRELVIFGSLARGDERADSDVDVLIGLRSDARVGRVPASWISITQVSAESLEIATVTARLEMYVTVMTKFLFL